MPFPSEALRAWCRNVEELRERMFGLDQAREDGWCQCGIGAAIGRAPVDQQAQLCSGLFWSIWIDQVLYTVSSGEGFYGQTFRCTYRFPKLYSHPTPGHASPAFLLSGSSQYERPGRELLLEDKEQFWGEIASWLRHLERQDILLASEAEFREDLRQRFAEDLWFLFAP